MNFLQPWILYALPLMALPILIHLINRHRHRSVDWAAMMFLVSAKRMNKGMARLRYVLIMLLRMLAIAVLVFVALWTAIGTVLAGTETIAWTWLEWTLDVLGGIATGALTWLLFPSVISAATALFLERVAEAVERRHYQAGIVG